MKAQFSKSWKRSKQIRKQRKYRAKAPLHIKQEMLNAHLSKELIKKYNRRSFPVRKDDQVKIMRGEFKGKSGKVIIVDHKRSRIAVDGIQRKKKDGTKLNVWFNASKLQISELDLKDKYRLESISRGKKHIKKEKLEEKKDK